jgi:Ca2+-binding EF-hand superfamily protein
MIIVDQQNMAFPDLLIIMAQKNSGGTSLHPVRDLFRSYDIDKRGVINADEMTGECQ